MAYKTEIERMIYKKAREGTPPDMEALLERYGKEPDILEIITKGAREHRANVTKADWMGDGESWDYGQAVKKIHLVEDFYLANKIEMPSKKSRSAKSKESISDLFKLVSNIASRLETLESAVAKNSAATPPASKA